MKIQEQNLDSGEKIELLFLTFDEFFDLATSESFHDVDIKLHFFEALKTPEKMHTLRDLFS